MENDDDPAEDFSPDGGGGEGDVVVGGDTIARRILDDPSVRKDLEAIEADPPSGCDAVREHTRVSMCVRVGGEGGAGLSRCSSARPRSPGQPSKFTSSPNHRKQHPPLPPSLYTSRAPISVPSSQRFPPDLSLIRPCQ